MIKKQGVLRASGSGCCISAFANAPHPNAAKLSSTGFSVEKARTSRTR
jgi:hypothetical protein